MLSDDLRGLVIQARRNLRDPAFLIHVLDRLDEAAAQMETMERSWIIQRPPLPPNVVSLDERRRRE